MFLKNSQSFHLSHSEQIPHFLPYFSKLVLTFQRDISMKFHKESSLHLQRKELSKEQMLAALSNHLVLFKDVPPLACWKELED